MHFFVFKRRTLYLIGLIVFIFIIGSIWLNLNPDATPAIGGQNEQTREIHLVTGEFKSKTDDGKEIEAYRWDPGTIFIEKGEKVSLNILGVNGKEHPFIIEGTEIKGVVKKGEETVVPLQFDKEGTYRLICLTHPSAEHNGPMIAYIVVD
ncbi:cupredoxin domain-containing protein [Bacillus sp. ISL-35]|uniref:cupredoxin domain-containing protein n=1 Tax=Bacillus sp. ISL-35 TaxID=2819122 RepID=UPI001BECD166|nr:cupredoxin domain-containing protein [Bacillus sp. ISL-35]MBT2677937.1 cupredoxin domain-containing protein [Bacillus sp. ISL-35]MBT2705480.1 cupredoxin domain-containing protein [Chryseobacterium sp. ISL-80]